MFIAVGTPPDEDGSADLQYVLDVAREVGSKMEKYVIVVNKSTVPVGTAEKVRAALRGALMDRLGDLSLPDEGKLISFEMPETLHLVEIRKPDARSVDGEHRPCFGRIAPSQHALTGLRRVRTLPA